MSVEDLVHRDSAAVGLSPLTEDVISFIEMKGLAGRISATHSITFAMLVNLLLHCMCSAGADASTIRLRDLKSRATTFLQANFSNNIEDEVLMYDDQNNRVHVATFPYILPEFIIIPFTKNDLDVVLRRVIHPQVERKRRRIEPRVDVIADVVGPIGGCALGFDQSLDRTGLVGVLSRRDDEIDKRDKEITRLRRSNSSLQQRNIQLQNREHMYKKEISEALAVLDFKPNRNIMITAGYAIG